MNVSERAGGISDLLRAWPVAGDAVGIAPLEPVAGSDRDERDDGNRDEHPRDSPQFDTGQYRDHDRQRV